MGGETQLGKQFGGTELSGGEWQKIALARAFANLNNVSFIILDEPSAALDPASEQELYERFQRLIIGRTSLLITHRLGSIRYADRILVLKNGELAEEGTHQDLVEMRGEYYRLWNLQAEQYLI